MATQMKLFEFETHYREIREMTKASAFDAAAICVELLNESNVLAVNAGTREAQPIWFGDIVKRKMGIIGDSIPEVFVSDYAEQLKAVYDERARIKEIVEETGEFILKLIDSIGRPTIRGGAPAGFVRHDTAAGKSDTKTQLDMTYHKMLSVANQRRIVGEVTEDDYTAALTNVERAYQLLLTEVAGEPVVAGPEAKHE